jgi:hypothetical protein
MGRTAYQDLQSTAAQLDEVSRSEDRVESDARGRLPVPSHRHATCAWCGLAFATIVELLDHVELGHVPHEPIAA